MKKEDVAKKILTGLFLASAFPAASQAHVDQESAQTFLAQMACGASETVPSARNQPSSRSSTNRTQQQSSTYSTTQSPSSTNNPYETSSYQSYSSYENMNRSNPNQSSSLNRYTPNSSDSNRTTYSGTSTPPGPNDGYPSTPRGYTNQ